jgi:formylglycine-generating enzyme required for sulfatase activity
VKRPANLPPKQREGAAPDDAGVAREVTPRGPSAGEGGPARAEPGARRGAGLSSGRPPAPEQGKTPFEGTRNPASRGAIKILFVAADAGPERRPPPERERRDLRARLRADRRRQSFELVECWGATLEDVRQQLLEHTPDVVHFAAHGDEGAGLVLLDDRARPSPVPAGALGSLFQAFRREVRLVVVDACLGADQAAALRESVGLAVGMRGEASDRAALDFAGAFYEALGDGRSVREAFELGTTAVGAVDAARARAPRLFAGDGVDAADIFLAERRWAQRLGRDLALAGALCACGALAIALLARATPALGPPQISLSSYEAKPSPPGRRAARAVVVEGGDVTAGALDGASAPAECAGAAGDGDCTAAVCPGFGRSFGVATFSLDATEVTNEDFARWLEGSEGAWHLGPGGFGVVLTNASPPSPLAVVGGACGGLALTADGHVRSQAGRERRPVACVSWQGASDYCRAAGKRLPSAAEWELAAKGPRERPFPWGAERPAVGRVAFGGQRSALDGPHDVARSPLDCTPEGVYDLGGNVAEWVQDDDGAGRKAWRGGSWRAANLCDLLATSAALRPPETYADDVGFRCASDLPNAAPKRPGP